MKKSLVILLLTFSLMGCSNSIEKENNNEKTKEPTVQETKQEEIKDEQTEPTTKPEEVTTETDVTSEEVTGSEDLTTEQEQLVNEDSDHYAICSSYSKEEIETFAKSIKTSILNKEWEELADKISYPITVGDIECANEEDFKKIAFDDILTDDFYTALEDESCEEMFCKSTGIMLGNGQVWIAEIIDEESGNGELKVIGIHP